MSESAIGLDLGGTQIKAVIVNQAGEIIRLVVRASCRLDLVDTSWCPWLLWLLLPFGR